MPKSDTQFKPGKSGNPSGREKGSRNKITKRYLDKLAKHFNEHGVAVLDEVRKDKPDVYLKLVAQLVPKDFDVNHSGDMELKLVSFLDVTPEDLET